MRRACIHQAIDGGPVLLKSVTTPHAYTLLTSQQELPSMLARTSMT